MPVKRFSISLEPEIAARLDLLAEECGVSRSEYVRSHIAKLTPNKSIELSEENYGKIVHMSTEEVNEVTNVLLSSFFEFLKQDGSKTNRVSGRRARP